MSAQRGLIAGWSEFVRPRCKARYGGQQTLPGVGSLVLEAMFEFLRKRCLQRAVPSLAIGPEVSHRARCPPLIRHAKGNVRNGICGLAANRVLGRSQIQI